MQGWHTAGSSIVLMFAMALAACAGNGGGAGGTAGTLPPIVAPLAPVSSGSNPIAAPFATPDGPTFANPPAAVFPLLFTGYQWNGGGLVPIAPGAGATLTLSLGAPPGAVQNPKAVSWQISVPSVGVTSSGFESAGLLGNFDSPIEALDYVAFGSWQWGLAEPSGDLGHFVFGFETPPASMPVSGTAAFSGAWEGRFSHRRPANRFRLEESVATHRFPWIFCPGKFPALSPQ